MALMHIDFFSQSLGMQCGVDAVIPEGFDRSTRPDGLRTLLLLHGMSDDQTIWQRHTVVERYSLGKDLAVIMPTTQLGWYTDMECGYQRYFTYISREVPRVFRSLFPQLSARREDNFVAGLSMGGYGAMKTALAESEAFCKAACFSGSYDVISKPDTPYWNSIFGVGEQREKHCISAYAEALLAENRSKPDFYIWCGTDDGLLDNSRGIRDYLIEKGFAVKYAESSGGHEWRCWDEQVAKAIDFFIG